MQAHQMMKRPQQDVWLVKEYSRLSGTEIDAEFAATYGIALALRRSRFLRDESLAWQVFGQWLVDAFYDPRKEAYYGAMSQQADLFARVLDAGIFFQFNDALLLRDDVNSSVFVRKSLLLGLYMRPHLEAIEANCMSTLRHQWSWRRRLPIYMNPEERSRYCRRLVLLGDGFESISTVIKGVVGRPRVSGFQNIHLRFSFSDSLRSSPGRLRYHQDQGV